MKAMTAVFAAIALLSVAQVSSAQRVNLPLLRTDNGGQFASTSAMTMFGSDNPAPVVSPTFAYVLANVPPQTSPGLLTSLAYSDATALCSIAQGTSIATPLVECLGHLHCQADMLAQNAPGISNAGSPGNGSISASATFQIQPHPTNNVNPAIRVQSRFGFIVNGGTNGPYATLGAARTVVMTSGASTLTAAVNPNANAGWTITGTLQVQTNATPNATPLAINVVSPSGLNTYFAAGEMFAIGNSFTSSVVVSNLVGNTQPVAPALPSSNTVHWDFAFPINLLAGTAIVP
jgi:hypothetical protein